MDERVIRFRVGVMVLATLMITAILIVLFGEMPTLTQQQYTVYISFLDAPGVTENTPVRKNGILVGRVTKIDFADSEGDIDAGVVVTARIDSKVKLHHNEYCQVGGQIFGDAVLQFVPSHDPKLPKTIVQDGELMIGTTSSDPLRAMANLEGSLGTTIDSVGVTSNEISLLARRVNDLLGNNNEQFARIVNKAEITIDKLNSTFGGTEDLLGDPQTRENLKRSIASMPQVMSDLQKAAASMQTTFDSADRNLKNVEQLTKPLGERGSRVVANIESATQRLDQVLADAQKLTTRFGGDQRGSLDKLLNDEELYNNLNITLTNVNELTRRLRPIIEDVRVITDKVARDPSSILRQTNGIK